MQHSEYTAHEVVCIKQYKHKSKGKIIVRKIANNDMIVKYS